MKGNGTKLWGVLRVLAAFAWTISVSSQMASARPQQYADQQIMIQEGPGAGPAGPVEIGFQSFRAMVPGKVVKGAPYSAVASTEMNQVLSDGNEISHKMTSNIYRDSQGRTRREEEFAAIGPLVVNGKQPHGVIFINDPVTGADYILEPENKIARKMPSLPADGIVTNRFFGTAAGTLHVSGSRVEEGQVSAGPKLERMQVSVGPGGPMPAESPFQTSTEPLGQQTIEGVAAEGKRMTTTIPAGTMGNQRPINIVTEEWFSSELQAVVQSTTKDPRMGETTYRLTNIQRTEPPATLFSVPADYTVKDFDKGMPFPRPPQSND
jgi:hypothetical protein